MFLKPLATHKANSQLMNDLITADNFKGIRCIIITVAWEICTTHYQKVNRKQKF